MAALSYCSEADLYKYGLPRGALPNPGRTLPEPPAEVAAGVLLLDQHGLASGDAFTLRAEAGGSLPAPLAALTIYYALPRDQNSLRAAATAGGAAITLTTVGSRVLLIVEQPIAAACALASRLIDDMLPSHLVPLPEPLPELVVMTAAELAVGLLGNLTGASSQSLTAKFDAAHKRLERWAKGIPLRGVEVTTHTNRSASAVRAPSDARGWRRFGGL